MKKLFVIVLSIIPFVLHAAWVSPISDGNWTQISWQGMTAPDTYPNSTDYDVNITKNITLDSGISVKSVWMKADSSLVFSKQGSLTTSASSKFDAAGSSMVFAGGQYKTDANLDMNEGQGSLIFGQKNSEGTFIPAAAKSIDATGRLQLRGESITFNVGDINLLSAKSSGMDENALIYAASEIQQFQTHLTLDLSNIKPDSAEDGTYYVALLSFGITYKSISGDEFNPMADFELINGDVATFEGFEWAHFDTGSTSTDRANNTLYAKINVSNAIPEPAVYAVVFGILAFAFAARKKRV